VRQPAIVVEADGRSRSPWPLAANDVRPGLPPSRHRGRTSQSSFRMGPTGPTSAWISGGMGAKDAARA